ncbi:ArsR/SmtB family transcription factor [Neisseriaceae bacterium B1]
MSKQEPNTHTRLAAQLRAMGQPEKLSILLLLNQSEYSLNELAGHTQLDATTLGNHLQKMRQLGMVDFTRFHRITQYRIISPVVQEIIHIVATNKIDI